MHLIRRTIVVAVLVSVCLPASVADDAVAKGNEIFEAVAQRYRGLKSYSDSARQDFRLVMRGGDGADLSERETTDMPFKYSNGDFYLESMGAAIYRQGDQMTIAVEEIGQYRQHKSPTFDAIPDDIQGAVAQHPIAGFLLNPNASWKELISDMTAIKSVETRELDGREHYVVTVGREVGPTDREMDSEVWVDAKEKLIRQITLDLTEAMRSRAEMMLSQMSDNNATYERAELALRFADAKVNEPVGADAFAFKAQDDMFKVEEFRAGDAKQFALIGKPAPSVAGELLDGGKFDLAEQRGKVVVLDFWATWCGPCRVSMPHYQTLADKYAEQGVMFVGVNRDDPRAREQVKKYMADNKLSFAQVMTNTAEAAEKYFVTGIPTTVLVDKEGKVADIHVGFAPGMEKDLEAQITKLLKGEKLAVGG